jgi:DNA mismatch repair ATPase MutL
LLQAAIYDSCGDYHYHSVQRKKTNYHAEKIPGARRRVADKGNTWHSFLRDNSNKTELFNFLADKIVKMYSNNTVLLTQEEDVVCLSLTKCDLQFFYTKVLQKWQNTDRNDKNICVVGFNLTQEEDVVCNQSISLEGLTHCNHEKADTRVFLHSKHAAADGNKSIMIKANDTDVLVQTSQEYFDRLRQVLVGIDCVF